MECDWVLITMHLIVIAGNFLSVHVKTGQDQNDEIAQPEMERM
jgi:hypothetical protein